MALTRAEGHVEDQCSHLVPYTDRPARGWELHGPGSTVRAAWGKAGTCQAVPDLCPVWIYPCDEALDICRTEWKFGRRPCASLHTVIDYRC
jgi:hypothetical protein